MRWFRKSTSTPRLLSLSPLRYDMTAHLIDSESTRGRERGRRCLENSDAWIHHASRIDSGLSWQRQTSVDDGETDETNYYNVKEMLIVVEKPPQRRWHSETRASEEIRTRERTARKDAFIREKRNPLLDRVKDTKLSCFRSSEMPVQPTDDGILESLGNCRIIQDEETPPASDTALTTDDRRSIKDAEVSERSRSKGEEKVDYRDEVQTSRTGRVLLEHGESFHGKSCFSAKIKSISDKFLKTSTNKFLAKLHRNNEVDKQGKCKSKKKLRSFSFGALPGLEEYHNRNPLYIEEDDDESREYSLPQGSCSFLADCEDGDSGIIVSDSTSFASDTGDRRLVFHCRSASGEQMSNRSELLDVARESRSFVKKNGDRRSASLESRQVLKMFQEQIQKNEEAQVKEDTDRLDDSKGTTQLVRRKSFQVVRLIRSSPSEELGIFIAKTQIADRGAPGYWIAHIVPDGLADRSKNLRVGDEIVNVNGRRLRGLSMSAAREILRSGPIEVDIVVTRSTTSRRPSARRLAKMRESSVDYENVQILSTGIDAPRQETHSPSSSSRASDSSLTTAEHSSAPPFSSPKTTVRHGKLIESGNSMNAKMLRRALENLNENDRRNFESSPVSSAETSQSSLLLFNSNLCTLPRRPRPAACSFHTVIYEKGPGKKSLGFTIVGGKDSPKGALGIFIKSILNNGQAAEEGTLRAGDEILAINGQVCHDLTHAEAVGIFKRVKVGPVALRICRRSKPTDLCKVSKSCADLLHTSNSDE